MQPLATPDDCLEAEAIAKADAEVSLMYIYYVCLELRYIFEIYNLKVQGFLGGRNVVRFRCIQPLPGQILR